MGTRWTAHGSIEVGGTQGTRTVREVNLFGIEAADSTLPDQGNVRTILIEYILEGVSHRQPREEKVL
jgi:hypothetical protein